MNCPNCIQRRRDRYGFRVRRQAVQLQHVGEVKCATGDSIKMKCPVCKATFYFDPTPTVTIRFQSA